MRPIFSYSIVLIFLLLSSRTAQVYHISDVRDDVPFPYIERSTDIVKVATPLPDTIYPSVRAIKYTNNIYDTIHNAHICNFDDPYLTDSNNVLTFRGNRYRNGNFGGKVQGIPRRIVKDWVFNTDYDMRKSNAGQWGGGTGWTGQPLLYDSLVICSSLCSKVYFLDWETGHSLQKPINVRNPIKGTAMLDPDYPNLLYVGHGVAAEKPWGCLTIDINKGQIIQFFPEDKKAWRRWGAYDSSPLRAGDYIFRPGENGTLYKWYVRNDTISLHSTLQYSHNGTAPGMEASMAIYRNYGYTADNEGNIICTNLNTMQPVWYYNNHDDTDASLVLEVGEHGDTIPYLYTGCEVDNQGPRGHCYLIKLNALNGEKVWETRIPCRKVSRGDKATEGGIFATPLLGQGNCSDRLFISCITNKPAHHGDFMAIDKYTGDIIYSTNLDWYPWMSPIGFLNENDEQFIVAGDTQGQLYLINGTTGEILYKEIMGNNFESSPAVRSNSFVVGSRGTEIFKFHVE